jgi:hypothetical protein
MRRRKLRWVVAAGVALGLACFVALALWPRPDRITQENCDRITRGMSREEVCALLGPPGDSRTILTEPDLLPFTMPSTDPPCLAVFDGKLYGNRSLGCE